MGRLSPMAEKDPGNYCYFYRSAIFWCLTKDVQGSLAMPRTVENMMFNWLDSIPYTLIILKNETQSKPLNLFDLVFHLVATVLLVVKIMCDAGRSMRPVEPFTGMRL
jgi:hypothetical protein